ncbi:MAG TPA: hypothetical protein VIQ00_08655, partial [Chitinophagaceae bacterium]
WNPDQYISEICKPCKEKVKKIVVKMIDDQERFGFTINAYKDAGDNKSEKRNCKRSIEIIISFTLQ